MATREAVARALAFFAEDRGGDVTPPRLQIWCEVLKPLTDIDLNRAVGLVLRSDRSGFIPPVSALIAAVTETEPVDHEELLKAIGQMGVYSPISGMCWPRIGDVRERLGDAIATAYADAGASRVFSDNETSRDIARREFRQSLRTIARERGRDAIALPAMKPTLHLTTG